MFSKFCLLPLILRSKVSPRPRLLFVGPTSPSTIANVIFGAPLNSFFRLQGDFVLRVRGADTDAAGEAGVQFNSHFEFWVQA